FIAARRARYVHALAGLRDTHATGANQRGSQSRTAAMLAVMAVHVDRTFEVADRLSQLLLPLDGHGVVTNRQVHVAQSVGLGVLEVGRGTVDGDDRLDAQLRQRSKARGALGNATAHQVFGVGDNVVHAGQVGWRLRGGGGRLDDHIVHVGLWCSSVALVGVATA